MFYMLIIFISLLICEYIWPGFAPKENMDPGESYV